MPKELTYTDIDATLRCSVYQFMVTRGHVFKIRELAAALSRSEKAGRSDLRSLASAHSGASAEHLENSSRRSLVGRADRFSRAFRQHAWWASSIWDALAIPAILCRDARITTACACCDSSMEFTAFHGRLQPGPHFAGTRGGAGAVPGKFRAVPP